MSHSARRSPQIDSLADDIVGNLERLGRAELLRRLQPGLAPDDVRAELTRLGLAHVDDVVDLYRWRNGTRVPPGTPLDGVHFFPGFYFLSLEDAVANLVTFRDDARWKGTWLPIFANGGGDFYSVDCSSPDAGPVVGFMVDQSDQPTEFASVSTMMATIRDSYAEGAFFVQDHRYLEMDDDAFAAIARRHNPGLEFWTPR